MSVPPKQAGRIYQWEVDMAMKDHHSHNHIVKILLDTFRTYTEPAPPHVPAFSEKSVI